MAAHKDPSALPIHQPGCVLVGLDSHGNWIARDAFGSRGGIFISCAAALRFARFEFGLRALPIVMSDGNIELECRDADPTSPRSGEVDAHRQMHSG